MLTVSRRYKPRCAAAAKGARTFLSATFVAAQPASLSAHAPRRRTARLADRNVRAPLHALLSAVQLRFRCSVVLLHIQAIPLYRLRGEATCLHPIQRETAGKVARNLVGNGVME